MQISMQSRHYPRLKKLCYCVSVLMFTDQSSLLFSTAYAGDLPPAPDNIADLNQVYKLYLELVVNDYSTQKVVPVVVKADQYFILRSQLDELEIKLPQHSQTDLLQDQKLETTAQQLIAPQDQRLNNEATTEYLTRQDILMLGFSHEQSDWVNLSQTSGISFDYLSARQAIQLQLPPEWMPTQMLGRDSWYKPEIAQSGVGFLNNYDFYMSRPYVGNTTSNLFTEQRFFSPYGVFRNTGIYSHQQQEKGQNNTQQFKNGYRRYDTNWQYDHQGTATTVIVGDIISATKNNWGNAVRMGGIQIKRDFGTRPDLITYPLPQFSGQAALPSTVDLIINGQQSQKTDVQSGPFVINNMPFVTGRGEAVIVTTDAVGRQVSTSVPFYVSNDILKPGLIDYSFSTGVIREDFALKDFQYGKFATSADARYGLYDWLTLESRAELSQQIQLVGVGTVLKLFNMGVLSASYTDTRSDASLYQARRSQLQGDQRGAQYSLGYSYNQSRFGFNVQHTQRDRTYADLSRLAPTDLISANSHQSTTANTYFSTARTGTYGIGYIEAESESFKTQLVNFSWAPVLPDYLKSTTMTFSLSQNLIDDEWSAALQMSFPLFKSSSTMNAGISRDAGLNSGYVNYNRSVPSDGGFGFDITQRYRESKDPQNQARISYRNQYINTEFGASGENSELNYWLGLRGSVVIMDQGIFAANRLGESFALIDTQVADVPVRYENSQIGRSNRNGHIFVPSISPYYAGNFSIDPLGLSSSYSTNFVEQRIAAKRGSGIKINFPIEHNIAANVYLVDENNQPLPVAAMVHRADLESSYVGMDGIAYLTQLQPNNRITVQLEKQRFCSAEFDIDVEQAKKQILTVEQVLCREIKE